MNEGKIGTVLITDENDSLIALLSDGDLRRALGKDDFDLSLPALHYATKNPISLDDENLLATYVLKQIEAKKIQLLPITDKNSKILGTIHIHDLVDAGIKS